MNKMMNKFLVAVLNDEQGINEDAYNILLDLVTENGDEWGEVTLIGMVNSCEGRYYISKDAAELLLSLIK